MPRFQYQALSASGELVAGEIEGPDVTGAIALLNEQALLPIRATEMHAGGGRRLNLTFARRQGFRPGGLPLFVQQLSRLLNASLPLDRALEILTSLMEDGRARRIVATLLERVRDGSTLAEAMAQQPEAFPSVGVSIVRAGEEAGALRQVLGRVGAFLVRSEAIRQKVISALIYPAILALIAIGSIVLILTFVLPQFETMFEDAGDKLPMATRFVIAASSGLREYWWLLLLGVAVSAAGLQFLMRRPAVLALRDRVALRLPMLGDLVTRFEVSRFARSLGVLLANGVPASRALALASGTVSNRLFTEAIETLAARFKEGEGLAASLAQAGCFPTLTIQLIQIGEETGRLEDMLQELSDIYDSEVERTLERLLALLVPGITILMGLVIAVIMAAVLTAMVSINELVS